MNAAVMIDGLRKQAPKADEVFGRHIGGKAIKSIHDAQVRLSCARELANAPTTRAIKGSEVIPIPPGKNPWDIAWKQVLPKGVRVISHPEAKNEYDQFDKNYDLKELGCWDETLLVSWSDIMGADVVPPEFSYIAGLLPALLYGFALSLGVAVVVYGVVRAIGWVIGGFAA